VLAVNVSAAAKLPLLFLIFIQPEAGIVEPAVDGATFSADHTPRKYPVAPPDDVMVSPIAGTLLAPLLKGINRTFVPSI
jgi:hypothetical protein